MCCFSIGAPVGIIARLFARPVHVSSTHIFARMIAPGVQALAYGLNLSTTREVAMILPVPVVPGSGDDALRFVSLEREPRMFEELDALFAEVREPLRRGGLPAFRAAAPTLVVHQIGSFIASYVPRRADFTRLDARFRLPDVLFDAVPAYADYGFAVFQLAPGKVTVHPMAMTFPTRAPDRLFFPTVHVHDGKFRAAARFDHALYYQRPGPAEPGDETAVEPPRKAYAELVAPAQPIARRTLRAKLPNADTWIAAAAEALDPGARGGYTPRLVIPPVSLTVDRLRAHAGPSFARGDAYWRQGRVVSCRALDDEIDGVVAGTRDYRVRLGSENGALTSRCTCPIGERCKHAVALGLAYLASARATAAAAAPAAAAPPPRPAAAVFATRAELDAWAAAHHADHALALCADVVSSELAAHDAQDRGLHYLVNQLSLRQVGSLEGASAYFNGALRERARPLAEAAYRVLRREAALVRAGLEEEARRAEVHADPVIAPLWAKLLAARRQVREVAYPRGAAARALGAWSFDAQAVAIAWKERARLVRAGPAMYGAVTAAARLAMPGGLAPRLECACAGRDARCTHALALLDATLDVLADEARADEARLVATELLRPGWSRALQELERLDQPAKPRAVIEVWWSLEEHVGPPALSATVKKVTKSGKLSAGTRATAARLLDEHGASLADADRRIAELLAAWTPTTRSLGSYPARAVAALVGHPRVLANGEPVTVVRLPLGFTALPAGAGPDASVRLEPALGGERLDPRLLDALLELFERGEPLFLHEPERRRCVLIDVGDEARRMWDVLARHGELFPPESHAALLDRLARLEARVPVAVPERLRGRQLAAAPVVVVRLRLLPDVSLELELLVRPAPGAPLFQPGDGPRDVMVVRDGERGYVRRALGDEHAWARARLAALPLDGAEEGPPGCFRLAEPDAALRLVAAVQAPPDGIEAEWLDPPPVVGARPLGPDALRVRIERRRDWFGIDGDVKLEAGRLELAVLLDAARRQQRYVRVDERRWVELSDALRERLRAVSDQAFAGKQRVELSPGAVHAIRALEEAGAAIEAAPAWSELAARVQAAAALRPKPPAGLRAELRDYQREGHAWLARVAAWGAGACLADDMGLGKTVQAIALLLDRAKLGPALVLAPTSVAHNWIAELARFAPGLRAVRYADAPDRAACLAGLGKRDVLIASYGLLANDADLLAGARFATLVVDEAQALKNPNTRRARAARRLDAAFRVALSGTPFENHLGELWSLFAIVFPGLLGSWDQFRDRFAIPIERHQDADARAALARVLRPFLLRRTKAEVARELPARTEVHVAVAQSPEERALYDDARLAAVAELTRAKGLSEQQRRFQVLAALTRLRLLASHPKLYDPRSPVASSKLGRLLEILDELRREGHRALVFSQFTSHLELVRAELERAGFATLYLDGATPAKQRAALIERFQAGEGDAFLISLKAGGTGINLTAADYVIHLDPWWNPAVEDQASDRAHRIGQRRPVTVYRLIAHDTIEDQIVQLHAHKRALVAGILDGSDAAARLSTRDLLALLDAPA